MPPRPTARTSASRLTPASQLCCTNAARKLAANTGFADAGPGPEVTPAGDGARAAAWQRTVGVEVVGGRGDRLDRVPERQLLQGGPLPVDHAMPSPGRQSCRAFSITAPGGPPTVPGSSMATSVKLPSAKGARSRALAPPSSRHRHAPPGRPPPRGWPAPPGAAPGGRRRAGRRRVHARRAGTRAFAQTWSTDGGAPGWDCSGGIHTR
jgi:hypothetical protein